MKNIVIRLAVGTVFVVTLWLFPPAAPAQNTVGLPTGPLVEGGDGNFYGVASRSIFKMTPDGVFTILHLFSAGDGPFGRLAGSNLSSLYGVTANGTIFTLRRDGTGFEPLYTFTGGVDGGLPGSLVQGSAGYSQYLYGTTGAGGNFGHGTIFRITTDGSLETLFHFSVDVGGAGLTLLTHGSGGSLISGNFFGTTYRGGNFDKGILFTMTPEGAVTALFHFDGSDDFGAYPGYVTAGSDGYVYGASYAGGMTRSTLFRFTPYGLQTFYHFGVGAEGSALVETGRTLFPPGKESTTFWGLEYGGGGGLGVEMFRFTAPTSLVALPPFPAVGDGIGFTPNNGGSDPQGLTFRDGRLYVPCARVGAYEYDNHASYIYSIRLPYTGSDDVRTYLFGPPAYFSPRYPTAFVGQLFCYQLLSYGNHNPTTYTASNLPPGLSLNSTLGVISGTPTEAGNTKGQLVGENYGGSSAEILNFTVQPAPTSGPQIVNGSSITVRNGQPFAFQVRATGITSAATFIIAGELPGLTIDSVTGLISGTPDGEDGRSYPVTITVRDGSNSTSATLQITVTSDPAVPVITSAAGAALTQGGLFNYTITAPSSAGLSDPTIFSISGTLPQGLTFDPTTGTITGTYTGTANELIIASVQLFAHNSHGTATIPLSFLRSTPSPLGNISTRLQVGTDANVMIAGFIVQGSSPKRVLIRAAGPSLANFGVPNVLANSQLELHDTSSTLGKNDDWQTTQIGGVITSDQAAEIQNSGLAPSHPLESTIIATLAPGSYTAIVKGVNGGTGVGIVEAYDLNATSGSLLANIATRGFVQTGDNAMIGGFIVVTQPARVIIRAIGPSLTQFGVPDALANPQLELRNASSTIAQNNDWQMTQIGGIIMIDQVAEIQNSQLAPTNAAESAIIATLQPGSYTAIVRGVNNTTGNALVEVYALQ